MSDNLESSGIAIVGMAGRFPGAPDVDALWKNLCAGVESVRSFSDEELRAAGVDTSAPGFVNAGAAMPDIEMFDAPFFGMSRREAEVTDPQHRVVLETAWATLEQAGYEPGVAAGRVGIFGGVAVNLYYRHNLRAHPEILARIGDVPLLLATEREYAITRTAYRLGLEGPAVSVNTACSTSAVATHLAVQSLLSGETDIALAGGAYIRLPAVGYIHQEGGILSADGHVRAFDADANGTVMGSGVAFVALKRLADALGDRDTVYAVIRGTAINNDGAGRANFTAPGVAGQAAVITEAMAVADVDAATIGLLEAHGTATSLGDPIEVSALAQAYRRHTDRRQYCAIGSVKSNVGHLDAAAGVTGIIKAALSLYHERIPPSINYHRPNPQIDFESSPFHVNTELVDWRRTREPRRAGVSSFGFGGTNAHVVLEEAPLPEPESPGQPLGPNIITLSAKTAEALDRRAQRLADHLSASPTGDLVDVAHTLAVGRARMPFRRAVVATDAASAAALLRHPDPGASASRTSDISGAEVAFMFTGQGAQYPGMGAGLYGTEPVFSSTIDECAQILGRIDGTDLVDLLYGTSLDPAAAETRLLQTSVGQPAILAIQVALSRLWASWGVAPAAMVGHSVGELAAAHLGGVFSLDDALRLAAARGAMMQAVPTGAMTAVVAPEDVLLPLLDAQVSLAAVNAAEQCVASGPPASIDALEERLTGMGIRFRRLATDRAFHSPMMEGVIDPLRDHVAGMARAELRIPMVSTLTGTWTTSVAIGDRGYWGAHARRTVRFADAVGVLLAERPGIILIEVGPGETLASLARQHPAVDDEQVILSSLPHRGADADDTVHARRALADAWAAGVDVDWPVVNGEHGRRIPLPTYPFARERFWLEDGPAAAPVGRLILAPPLQAPEARPPVVAEAGLESDRGTRKERIVGKITTIIADMSGLEVAALDPDRTFTELGFDSLFLTQVNAQVRSEFGVRITLGQLLGDTSTIGALASRIDEELEPEPAATVVPASATAPGRDVIGDAAPSTVAPGSRLAAPMALDASDGNLPEQVAWLVMEQLRIMDEQLDLIQRHLVEAAPASTNGADHDDGPQGAAWREHDEGRASASAREQS